MINTCYIQFFGNFSVSYYNSSVTVAKRKLKLYSKCSKICYFLCFFLIKKKDDFLICFFKRGVGDNDTQNQTVKIACF